MNLREPVKTEQFQNLADYVSYCKVSEKEKGREREGKRELEKARYRINNTSFPKHGES